MPAEISQLNPRRPHPSTTPGGYRVVTIALPKFAFVLGPHSPFITGFVRSQSGTKLPLASDHDRVVVVDCGSPEGETL